MTAAADVRSPASAEDIQALLVGAGERGETVAVAGGGAKAGVGAPETTDHRIDLSALAALERYEPGELVLRAQAGMRLRDLEALLAEHGQMLAFEPPDFGRLMGAPTERSTLAGAVAAGLSGPRRIAAGAVRDHVLGFDAVSGRGDIFKAGGPVVKNVTGYDLPKLISGSWGTLAVLTSVTLKVLPQPKTSATLRLDGLAPEAACRAMSLAMGGPWSVTGAAHLPSLVFGGGESGKGATATILRLEGFEPSVEARVDSLAEALAPFGEAVVLEERGSQTIWRWVRDVGPFWGIPRRIWRVSVPPADGWRLLQAVAPLGGEAFMDWAGGLVWLALGQPDAAAEARTVREAAHGLGGHAMLFGAPEADRAAVAAVDLGSEGLTLLSARVKTAFDPKGVLSPRRFAGAMGLAG